MRRKAPIPKFASEEEERQFWSRTDSADHIDWSKAEAVSRPELKPTLKGDLSLSVESSLEDLEDAALGAQRLADEEDPLIDWDEARRALLDQD